jgi:hypothetical protein
MRCCWCMALRSAGAGVCADTPLIQLAESAVTIHAATLAARTLMGFAILDFIVFSILLVVWEQPFSARDVNHLRSAGGFL